MKLTVKPLKQKDAGRGLAAIDRVSMRELDLENGDYIVIDGGGDSQSVARVWPRVDFARTSFGCALEDFLSWFWIVRGAASTAVDEYLHTKCCESGLDNGFGTKAVSEDARNIAANGSLLRPPDTVPIWHGQHRNSVIGRSNGS